jgi:hypothetical protein
MPPNNFTKLDTRCRYHLKVSRRRLGLIPIASGAGQLNQVSSMRGIVIFALMFAVMAVVDAAFFKGRHLSDAEEAITGLASLSTQIGRR